MLSSNNRNSDTRIRTLYANLSWLLCKVHYIYINWNLLFCLRNWQRHANERIEGSGLPPTARAGQGRPKVSSKNLLYDGIIAPKMVCKRFRSNLFIRPTKIILPRDQKSKLLYLFLFFLRQHEKL